MTLDTGLESWWELQETVSTVRYDSHGTNHLTPSTSSPTGVAGKVKNGALFTAASSQYLAKTSNSSIQTGDIEFTFSFWMKATTLGANMTLLSKSTGVASTREFAVDWVSNTIRFFVTSSGSGSVVTAAMTADGLWHLVNVWHDPVANLVWIQVDNGTAVSAATTAAVATNTVDFRMGNAVSGGAFYDGILDSVGFWKRVLTAGERTSLYNSGNGLAYADLFGASVASYSGVTDPGLMQLCDAGLGVEASNPLPAPSSSGAGLRGYGRRRRKTAGLQFFGGGVDFSRR